MSLKKVNDCVLRFANVNGTGSASANGIFAKALFRMGIPIAAKNIFPSNIQGLPTWYEIRVSEKSYLGRRKGIDLTVAVNPQSFMEDIEEVAKGGYLVYDSSKPLHDIYIRDDINYVGIPMMQLSMEHYELPRHQQLFKNIIYIGALSALLNVDLKVIKDIIAEQFARKEKLIPPNYKALDLGYDYARNNFNCPLDISVEHRDINQSGILVDGNMAIALGMLYGGATVAAWYPITPSTSVTKAFMDLCKKYRKEEETGRYRVAIVQAEDELAAIGMAIGAGWNGARAFTATSGAGISLMTEFIGLAYFAEIPVVLVNVQRGGPSTGMPTRTQQADILSCAYASHGDTKHILLFPSTPNECFDMAVKSLDLAEQLQTPVFLMSDLDLGMNEHISYKFEWPEDYNYKRGKVYSKEDLDRIEEFGRYLDVDEDGIPYRTYPGTHPGKGAFFTRGTSKNEYAKYTENGEVYVRNVDRLTRKWNTAKKMVPEPDIIHHDPSLATAMVFFGTTHYAAFEAYEMLKTDGISMNVMRLTAFPFTNKVKKFMNKHRQIFVVEQNKDGQMKQLLTNELSLDNSQMISILNYDGLPITADAIYQNIRSVILGKKPKAIKR